MPPQRMRGALIALAFAAAASVWLHLTGERSVSGSSTVLGSPAYDMQSIVAPDASGPLLTALTYLLTATPLGPPVRRFLLNDNKVEILRELAAQAIDTPPLYYPMRRVGAAVHEAHTAAASSPDGSLSAALRDGFAPPSTAGDSNPNRAHVAVVVTRRRQSSTASVYTTSEDLHAAFRAGSTTPSKVVELVLARVEASGAFSSVLPSLAREAAAASTTRWADGSPLGVLDGVPMAVKDMIAVKGLPMFKGKVSSEPKPKPKSNPNPDPDPNPDPNPNPNPNPDPNPNRDQTTIALPPAAKPGAAWARRDDRAARRPPC